MISEAILNYVTQKRTKDELFEKFRQKRHIWKLNYVLQEMKDKLQIEIEGTGKKAVIRRKSDQMREASKKDTANGPADPVEASSSRPRRTTTILENGSVVEVERYGGAREKFIVIAEHYSTESQKKSGQREYVAAQRTDNKDVYDAILIRRNAVTSLYDEISSYVQDTAITSDEIKKMLDQNEWKLLRGNSDEKNAKDGFEVLQVNRGPTGAKKGKYRGKDFAWEMKIHSQGEMTSKLMTSKELIALGKADLIDRFKKDDKISILNKQNEKWSEIGTVSKVIPARVVNRKEQRPEQYVVTFQDRSVRSAIMIGDDPTELLATQLPNKEPQKGWKGTKVNVTYSDGSIVNGKIREDQKTQLKGKEYSRLFVIEVDGEEFMASLDSDRRLKFHSERVTRHTSNEAGCCPPDAACRVMSPSTTEKHVGFDHVDRKSAGMRMPMQPLAGYGGRPMKNLCWVPVVAAIAGTNCDEVLTTVYGCTHTSEDCPDERMDPLELLDNFYNIPCHDVFTSEDIHKVHQCKEYVADDFWEVMKTAVNSSKPILLLAASRSYRGYVHCLMVVGIHKKDTQILVTDACERGVFRSEFAPTCPKQFHCTDNDALGSLSLNVYINNKVCEQYRVICAAVF